MNLHTKSIAELPEFDDHNLVSFIYDNKAHLKGYIAIHRGGNGIPSLGATRFWNYKNENEAIRDVLNLSRMMSYKAAMAGLNCGGAKGVIFASKKAVQKKRVMFKAYARKVNYFKGGFITGTDVGVSQTDVNAMLEVSPYFVGTTIDPTTYTALGLLYALQACLKKKFGNESHRGRSFAIQGLGKIGSEFLRLIYKEAGEIYVTDVDEVKIQIAKKMYPRITVVRPNMIHTQNVDVFSPCALSGSLSAKNVSEMKASIVAGGANNQLKDERVGDLLLKSNIIYAPDYVANAGGLISVYDEYEFKKADKNRILKKVGEIKIRMEKILEQSERQSRPTNEVANTMAEKIFNSKEKK